MNKQKIREALINALNALDELEAPKQNKTKQDLKLKYTNYLTKGVKKNEQF